MKLDAHQHFWKYSAEEYSWISDEMPALKKDCLPQDLKLQLEKAELEGCVAVQARQSDEETRYLLGLAAEHDFIRGVVGWVDLRAGFLSEQLEVYKQHDRLKGFRHVVQDEPDDRFLMRPDFLSGVKQLGVQGYTYDILVFEKQMPAVIDLVNALEAQPMVLDHIGKPDIKAGMSKRWKDAITELGHYDHVLCKLSGMVTEADWSSWKPDDLFPYLEVVFKAFGPERLMIGSDWPVCLLAADDYTEVIDVVSQFTKGMSQSDLDGIYGDNAARFYNL